MHLLCATTYFRNFNSLEHNSTMFTEKKKKLKPP